MGIPNATKQAASNAVAALGNWISLHTGDAGTTGAAEASGGGYQRAQTSWTPTGTGNNGTEVTIPVAAGNYSQGGIWTAGGTSGGTFIGSGSFSSVIAISGTGASIAITPTINA